MIASATLLLLSSALLTLASESTSALEAELTEVERAFAKTMADRDLAAFRSFLAEDVIFLGRRPLRGPDAVVEGWRDYFEGAEAPFSWKPDRVVVIESGTLGLSTGSVLDPEGERTGTFHSTWRRTQEGWEVVLDVGCRCRPPEPGE